MATLRDIKRRIKSVQNTKQITKAMEMVAASKLRRAQQRAVQARPYAQGMMGILQALASASSGQAHPLFQKREIKNRAVIVIAADRGLAGAYSSNVMRAAEAYVKLQATPVSFYVVGRKSAEYMIRRRRTIAGRYTDLPALADFGIAQDIGRAAMEAFLSGKADQVDLIYTSFISTANRKVVTEPFLPISGEQVAGQGVKTRDYILEPDPDALFAALLPRYINTRLFAALAESYASEHGARMIAMGSATKNAGEMIDSLVLTRNRLRQAAITKEISEIVGGAEALA